MIKHKFPASRHIRKKKHFDAIFGQSKSVGNRALKIVVANRQLIEAKCAFVAGKFVGKAIVRNKARRRIKELVRHNQNRLHPNLDYVFIAKKGIDDVSFSYLKTGFIRLLDRINSDYESNNNFFS